MSLSGTQIPNLFANASASASFNSTGGAAAAAAADSGVLAVVLGAVSLGLVGVMGAVIGTNAIRR